MGGRLFCRDNLLCRGGNRGRTRASQSAPGTCLDSTGRFARARFELEEENVIKHFDEHSWAWADNPFVATRELNGLKIVMMWLSNWDAKDLRDVARRSNTADSRISDSQRRTRGSLPDLRLGGALGRWERDESLALGQCRFHGADAALRARRGRRFVKFGYTGQRTADIAEGIRVTDVKWLIQYLGQLTAAQMKPACGRAAARTKTPNVSRALSSTESRSYGRLRPSRLQHHVPTSPRLRPP